MEAFRRGVKETIASHHVDMGKGLDAEQVSKIMKNMVPTFL